MLRFKSNFLKKVKIVRFFGVFFLFFFSGKQNLHLAIIALACQRVPPSLFLVTRHPDIRGHVIYLEMSPYIDQSLLSYLQYVIEKFCICFTSFITLSY